MDWAEVRPLIEEALSAVPEIDAYLYEPGKTPPAREMITRTKRPKLTVAKAAILGLMRNYLAGLMDTGVSLLEIHKLTYFLQAAGEPLKLDYKPGGYGPSAENLRHVLKAMESHYIHGYGDGGDDPRKPIELAEGAAEQGRAFLQNHPETEERFEKVSGLIEGFESPYGMELIATVNWVADRQGAKSVDEAVEKVHDRSPRKAMFTPHQIQAAWDQLGRLGWIDVENHEDLGRRLRG